MYGISVLGGIFVFIGFFAWALTPMVGVVAWGITAIVFVGFNVIKDTDDEPDTLVERLRQYPSRKYYIAIPIVVFLGYLGYYYSDDWANTSERRAANRQLNEYIEKKENARACLQDLRKCDPAKM